MKDNNKIRKSGLVQVRGGFSDLNNIAPVNKVLQTDELDDRSRTQIINLFYDVLECVFDNNSVLLQKNRYAYNHAVDYANQYCKDIFNDVFCEKNYVKIGCRFDWHGVFEGKIQNVIENAVYNEVLDVIGYSCRWIEDKLPIQMKGLVFQKFNKLFERECIGYRFVLGRIAPITDQYEISAIQDACNNTYEGCRKQLQKAIDFLSDRDKKDYKNCIKESISAVESICQIITGNKKAVLSDALRQLEKQGIPMHPALKDAFMNLYGYTSDQGGIRHAEGMFESAVTFEEAKFMLVSCSAFINYLITASGKKSIV